MTAAKLHAGGGRVASPFRQFPHEVASANLEMRRPRRLTGAEIQLRQRAALPTPPSSTRENLHAP
jgi:hypothetical protein